MKTVRAGIIFLILCLAVSCLPWGLGQDDDVSSALSLSTTDIGTLAPYAYSSNTRATVDGNSYLSYTAPGSTLFKPLVFITDNGTRVVFRDAELFDAGDGFFVAYINQLQTIRKEPTVQYTDSGEVDENDNPIMIATTVNVDVKRNYGSNYAIINTNTGDVYLTMSLSDGREGVSIDTYYKNIIGTKDYIYFIGRERQATGNKDAVYRISKHNLEGGKLEALTNPAVMWAYDVTNASDNFVIFEQGVDNGPVIFNIIDLRNNLPATPITNGAYSDGTHYFQPFTYNYPFMLYGDSVYAFAAEGSRDGTNLGVLKYKVVEGQLVFDNLRIIGFPEGTGGYVHRLDVNDGNDKSTGLFAVRGGNGGQIDDTYYVVYTEITASGDDVKYMRVPDGDRSVSYYQEHDGKIYWISGLGAATSYIKTYDLSTGQTKQYQIPGKGAASHEFNIDGDGSVVYWQYLDMADVGTFRWNPETEDYPTLLTTIETNVHSIINIDTL